MVSPINIGTNIAGKYCVERVLGQGGMGLVVSARHLRLRSRVAIKLPTAPGGERGHLAERLLREGRIAMRLQSEHVARVYDVGTLDTGEPYLVMEYLVGRDLGAVMTQDGPLAVPTAVEYILQAIEGLAEAHANGVVHRDLKPSNLFLARRRDGSPIVKVIDFGISKTASEDRDDKLTIPGGTIGTPVYMAPEQMASACETDARSDLWSLGATLHALVTGTPPFGAGSVVEIHQRIQKGTPPLRASLPDAPPALEAALLRCMHQDPSARYKDVAELALALAEIAPEHSRESAVRTLRILSAGPADQEAGSIAKEELSDTCLYPTLETKTRSSVEPVWGDGESRQAATSAASGSERPQQTSTSTHKDSGPRRPTRIVVSAIVAGFIALAVAGWSELRPSSPKASASPGAGVILSAMYKLESAPMATSAPMAAPPTVSTIVAREVAEDPPPGSRANPSTRVSSPLAAPPPKVGLSQPFSRPTAKTATTPAPPLPEDLLANPD